MTTDTTSPTSIVTKILDITYDALVDLSAALLQGQNGFQLVMKTTIRNNLFPLVKFIQKEADLFFDTNEGTICGSILKWLNLDKKSMEIQCNFWSTNYYYIDKYLTQHRNNKIKKFKKQMKSELYLFLKFGI